MANDQAPDTGQFVDTNLLVLLVAGRTDRRLIAKHKRLSEFTSDDYDHLTKLIIDFGTVFVTPNTLTEASNLLAQHGEPERSRCFGTLRVLAPNGALNFRHLTAM